MQFVQKCFPLMHCSFPHFVLKLTPNSWDQPGHRWSQTAGWCRTLSKGCWGSSSLNAPRTFYTHLRGGHTQSPYVGPHSQKRGAKGEFPCRRRLLATYLPYIRWLIHSRRRSFPLAAWWAGRARWCGTVEKTEGWLLKAYHPGQTLHDLSTRAFATLRTQVVKWVIQIIFLRRAKCWM